MATNHAVVLLLLIQGCLTKHGDHCPHVGDCPEVDTAVENVDLTYSDHLCDAIRDIRCPLHHAVYDEQICGSDGVTYPNHCKFAKARCELLHSDNIYLDVANHCPCGITTLPTQTFKQTTAKPTTAKPTTAKPTDPQPTDKPTESTTEPMPPSTTITDIPTEATEPTTPEPPTTTLSVHNILSSVFCSQVGHVQCTFDFDIICGSDGAYYPNQCELAKEQCKDAILHMVDMSGCSV